MCFTIYVHNILYVFTILFQIIFHTMFYYILRKITLFPWWPLAAPRGPLGAIDCPLGAPGGPWLLVAAPGGS